MSSAILNSLRHLTYLTFNCWVDKKKSVCKCWHDRLLSSLGTQLLHSNPVWLYGRYILWSSHLGKFCWYWPYGLACYLRNLICLAPTVSSLVWLIIRNAAQFSYNVSWNVLVHFFLIEIWEGVFVTFDMSFCETFWILERHLYIHQN